MIKNLLKVALLGIFSFVLLSCEKDNRTNVLPENMAIIINQGNFSEHNGSLSVYDETNNTITNRAYEAANGSSIGASIMSGWVSDSKKAYIVCNNPDKIIVLDAKTIKLVGTPLTSNLANPRAVCGNQNYIFVSNWDVDHITNEFGMWEYTKSYISVYDAQTMGFLKKVLVGTDAEGILLKDNKLFVATKEGVKVLDITKSDLPTLATIRHQDAPGAAKNLAVDAYGKVWASFPQKGLVEINPVNLTATAVVTVPVDGMDGYICADGTGERILSYNTTYNAQWQPEVAKIHAVTVSTKDVKVLYSGTYFYGVGASPNTNNIFTAEVSFSSNSILKVLNPDGSLKKSETAGVGTSRYLFF